MATTEQQIYQALTAAGFSQVQAAGVMGNMENESDFNVEAAAVDSNGAESYGLIQWNAASYPSASSLVTGNSSTDLANQVQFLLHDTSGTSQGLVGSTPAQVASNWAQFVEVCAGCQPGGAQNVQRQSNANAILSQIQSSNWGAGGAGVAGTQNAQTTGIINGLGLPFPFDIPSILGSAIGNNVTGELTAGIGEGIGSGLTTAFTSITNSLLQKLGINGWKDLMIRSGLIILGAVILIIGLTHLTGGSQVSVSLPTGDTESAEETSDTDSGQSNSSTGSRSPSGRTTKTMRRSAGNRSTPGRKTATGVSSATHKFGSTAGELAEAAVAA